MCMSNVTKLNMTKGKNGLFTGIGYKSMSTEPILKRWKKAKCRYTKSTNKRINCDNGDTYHLGFHIFTKQIDAENYSDYCTNIYEVEYRNVTALGANILYKTDKSARCVIAQEMRFLRKIS